MHVVRVCRRHVQETDAKSEGRAFMEGVSKPAAATAYEPLLRAIRAVKGDAKLGPRNPLVGEGAHAKALDGVLALLRRPLHGDEGVCVAALAAVERLSEVRSRCWWCCGVVVTEGRGSMLASAFRGA